MTPRVCHICGCEITTGGVREFDDVLKRLVHLCDDCRKASVNQAAREANEDYADHRANASD